MKKVLVMAAMVLSSVGAFAQYQKGDITIQPKVGLNVSDFGDVTTGDNTKSKTRAGVTFGVEGEYHANTWLGISAGVMYSQQGIKFETTGNIVNGDELLGNGTIKRTVKLDYINIPILANFYVAKGLALKAGIQPGFNVSKKIKEEYSTSTESGSDENKINNGVKSFDFAFPVGISYEYCGFVLDARANFSVTNVNKNGEDKWKNEVLQLTLGYKFKL